MSTRGRLIATALVILFLVAGCSQAESARTSTPIATPARLTAIPAPSATAAVLPTPIDAPAPDAISLDTADQVELLRTLSGHGDKVFALAFSGDGVYIASASPDKTIRLWEVASGQEAHAFSIGEVGTDGVAFSPYGHLLASSEAIWDVDWRQEVYRIDLGVQGPVAFSPDGSILAVAYFDQPIRLWDVAGGEVLWALDGQADNAYHSIEFSPDGALLAAGGHLNGRVTLWDVENRQIARTLAHDTRSNFHGVAFSPDGRLLASAATEGTVKLWDIPGGQAVRTLTPGNGCYDVAFSPDGSLLASAGCDRTVKLWDVATGQMVRSLNHADEVMAVAFSPDGTLLASGCYDTQIYLWGTPGSEGTAASPAAPPTNPPADDASPAAPGEESRLPLSFEQSEQTFASIPTYQIGLADLDGDSDLDAVFSNAQANQSQVWLNDGHGFFTDSGQALGRYGHGVNVGDLDGDGDPDLLINTHQDSAPSRVYLNDGHAVFQELNGAFEVNIGFNVHLSDLDGDGDLDAVGEAADAAVVYQNDGAGAFSATELTFPRTTIWGDLDADGDVDVLVKEGGVGYAVHLNDGIGGFCQGWTRADDMAMGLGDMVLGDVDSDGDLDAVITNGHFESFSHPAMIFLNDGTGQFADSGQRLSAVRNAGVGLGDLDADGDLDLVLADHMEPCQVWLNDGRGRFGDSGLRFGGGQFYRHIQLGDLDGDNDLDIFLATSGISAGPNEIWFNTTPQSPSAVGTSVACGTDDSNHPLVLLGTLIDGTGAEPLPDGALIIQGDRIVAVGPRSELSISPCAHIINLLQATILPGFFNTHVHNAYNSRNLQVWAQAGVTTVRDLGQRLGWPFFSSRERLSADPFNARLIIAGPLVTVPGGYPIAGNNFSSLTVTSPDDARAKIEDLIDDGVDVIKITLTSGGAPSLSPEEAAAIVAAAHERGIPVSAHATTAADLRRALDAGVDDVAHMAIDRVPDELIRRMIDAGVSWVPTLEPLGYRGQDNLRRFVQAGGRVALGNDGGYLQGIEIGMPMREIHAMYDAGLTPMQIIVAATRDAAHVCRQADLLGTLEAGKAADVLVVNGDPLRNLDALRQVLLVIHGGVIIRNETSEP